MSSDKKRERAALIDEVGSLRLAGITLGEIAARLGFSREYIRLLEIQFLNSKRGLLDKTSATLSDLGIEWIKPEHWLLKLLDEGQGDSLDFICWQLKIARLQTSSEVWYLRGKPAFIERLRQNLPLTKDEAENLVGDSFIPGILEATEELGRYEVVPNLGLIRRTAKVRDSIYLKLLTNGAPLPEELLSKQLGVTVRNLRAHVDRDKRFQRNVAIDEIALSEWHLSGFAIKDARSALRFVLETSGPQKRIELMRAASNLYPRTMSRYAQLLEDPEFGLTESGLIGLSSEGAVPIADTEPVSHPSIVEHANNIVALSIAINRDVIRGAGVPVHRRLGWLVGLRFVGESKTFVNPDLTSITVKRFPGTVSLGSIRKIVSPLALREGCSIEVAFSLHESKFAVRGTCECHWLLEPVLGQ